MEGITVLIDGDNISAKYFKEVFNQVQKWGSPRNCRVFGSSSSTNLTAWCEGDTKFLANESLEEVRLPPGKNSTDLAMTIVAMDLLHRGELESLCLVSSDGDFVPLVQRMKESGIKVYGLGAFDASKSLREACNTFHVLGARKPLSNNMPRSKKVDTSALALLRETVAKIKNKDGWSQLNVLSVALARQSASYAENRWGFSTLSILLRFTGVFEIKNIQKTCCTREICNGSSANPNPNPKPIHKNSTSKPVPVLNDKQVLTIVDGVLERLPPMRRVLLLAPDASRASSLAGMIASHIYKRLSGTAVVHLTPTVGTHEPDAQDWQAIHDMYEGIPESAYRLHHHDRSESLADLGTISCEETTKISGGSFAEPVPVQINRNLLEGNYDRVFSIGQVVPHEVMGFANYDKNLFIGVGAKPFIDASHWVSAVCGIDQVLGDMYAAPRRLLDVASKLAIQHPGFPPVTYLLTVRGSAKNGDILTHALFRGSSKSVFYKAAHLSRKVNCHKQEVSMHRIVVRLDEKKYRSLWLANKAIYRTRKAIAPEGEIVVLAPGLNRLGESDLQSNLIAQYGYCGTERVKQLVKSDSKLEGNLGVAAHLIHGSTEGRFSVRLCTNHHDLLETECQASEGTLGYSLNSYDEGLKEFGHLTVGRHLVDGQHWLVIDDPGLGLWSYEEG